MVSAASPVAVGHRIGGHQRTIVADKPQVAHQSGLIPAKLGRCCACNVQTCDFHLQNSACVTAAVGKFGQKGGPQITGQAARVGIGACAFKRGAFGRHFDIPQPEGLARLTAQRQACGKG